MKEIIKRLENYVSFKETIKNHCIIEQESIIENDFNVNFEQGRKKVLESLNILVEEKKIDIEDKELLASRKGAYDAYQEILDIIYNFEYNE